MSVPCFATARQATSLIDIVCFESSLFLSQCVKDQLKDDQLNLCSPDCSYHNVCSPDCPYQNKQTCVDIVCDATASLQACISKTHAEYAMVRSFGEMPAELDEVAAKP